jgi:hypothetical protein
MILVADGWRRCAACKQLKSIERFNAKSRWPDGRVRFYQSYCKPCARQRNRELNGWKPRRRMSAAQRAKRAIEKRERYEARILADPVLFAEAQAKRRMDARLYRDRQRGGPPRPYPLRKTKRGTPVTERYRPPSYAEMVSSEPLRNYLKHTYHGWTHREIGAEMGNSSRLGGNALQRIFNQDTVELAFADRVLTVGLRRPDLLNDLYPLEEAS